MKLKSVQLGLFADISPSLSTEEHLSREEDALLDESQFPKKFHYHPAFLDFSRNAAASRIGDWGEHIVIGAAMLKGAETFRNVSCVGDTDLVINYNDIVFRVDAKVARRCYDKKRRYVSWRQAHPERIMPGVYGVSIVPAKTGIHCRWYQYLVGKYNRIMCPPGLENFWDNSLL